MTEEKKLEREKKKKRKLCSFTLLFFFFLNKKYINVLFSLFPTQNSAYRGRGGRGGHNWLIW